MTMKPPPLKPLFIERMKKLLENDFENYIKSLEVKSLNSIRCNTLKISPDKLKKRLEDKNWKIKQPFKENPEIMIIESELQPGEIGRSLEHLLGYYYVQDIASMLPVLALKPKINDFILDLCAAPGSKTTQLASEIKNTGLIIANEVNLGRLSVLASNLDRCGVLNVLITKKEGISLCKRFENNNFNFDCILIDAPCSGEGTIKSNPKSSLMWNIHTVKQLSSLQKNLVSSALEILNKNGILIYSTCTHSPEENEEVIDFILKEFKGVVELEKINLPLKTRKGIREWENKKYSKEVENSIRVYPQDNGTEGFFIARLRRVR